MLDKIIYVLRRFVIGAAICLAFPCALALVGTIPLVAMYGFHEWVFVDAVGSGIITIIVCMILFLIGGSFDYLWRDYGKPK